MPTTISCDAAISDGILQAARAALPKDPGDFFLQDFPGRSLNDSRLLALLAGLIDATGATARAVEENAFAEGALPRDFCHELAGQLEKAASAVRGASAAPPAADLAEPAQS